MMCGSEAPGDLCPVAWRRSARSGPNGGACVEVGLGAPMAGVRDSKDVDGPALWFGAGAWSGFLDAVKRGQLG